MVNPNVTVRLYDLDIKSFPEVKDQLLQIYIKRMRLLLGRQRLIKMRFQSYGMY